MRKTRKKLQSSDAAPVEKVQKGAKKPVKKVQKRGNERIKSLELEYLPKMYEAWEKVQSLMNELDVKLSLRVQPPELAHFDFACARMEDAFEKLEDEIKGRD